MFAHGGCLPARGGGCACPAGLEPGPLGPPGPGLRVPDSPGVWGRPRTPPCRRPGSWAESGIERRPSPAPAPPAPRLAFPRAALLPRPGPFRAPRPPASPTPPPRLRHAGPAAPGPRRPAPHFRIRPWRPAHNSRLPNPDPASLPLDANQQHPGFGLGFMGAVGVASGRVCSAHAPREVTPERARRGPGGVVGREPGRGGGRGPGVSGAGLCLVAAHAAGALGPGAPITAGAGSEQWAGLLGAPPAPGGLRDRGSRGEVGKETRKKSWRTPPRPRLCLACPCRAAALLGTPPSPRVHRFPAFPSGTWILAPASSPSARCQRGSESVSGAGEPPRKVRRECEVRQHSTWRFGRKSRKGASQRGDAVLSKAFGREQGLVTSRHRALGAQGTQCPPAPGRWCLGSRAW